MGAAKRKIGTKTILAATAALALAGPMTACALDMQLQINGITVDKTPIPVLSWSWGASFVLTTHIPAEGKSQVADASFSHNSDASSSRILQRLLTGNRITQAILSVYSSSTPSLPRTFLFRVVLDDVVFTSMQNGMSSDDSRPTEQVSMTFGKLTVRETRGRNDVTTACYDVAQNLSCL